MSKRFPAVAPRKIIRLLKTKGFEERRVSGSHHIMRHRYSGKIIPVPVHGNKDLKLGTLRSILKQAGISRQELEDFLKS